MSEKENPESIIRLSELAKEEEGCRLEHIRYEDTVRIVQVLVKFFKENSNLLDEIIFGKSLKSHLNSEKETISPDIISVYDNWKKGLLIEIKWSLSRGFQLLTKEISNLKKYTHKLSGWDDALGRSLEGDISGSHDLILLCHSDLLGMVRETIKELSKSEPLGYKFLNSTGFAVWSWSEEKNRKREKIIRIRNQYGILEHSKLDTISKDKIDVMESDFLVERAQIIFIGDEPPTSYVILRIMMFAYHMILRSSLADRETPISLKQLCQLFEHYYPPITKYSSPQVRISDIRNGCEILVKIGYNFQKIDLDEVKERELDEKETWYIVKKKLPRGELYRWVCKSLVKLKREEEEKKRRKEEREKRKIALRKKRTKLEKDQASLSKWLNG